jgi:hypothetical protein
LSDLGFPCPWIIGRITIEDMRAVFFQVVFGYLLGIYISITRKEERRMYIVPITIRYLLIYILTYHLFGFRTQKLIHLSNELYNFNISEL